MRLVKSQAGFAALVMVLVAGAIGAIILVSFQKTIVHMLSSAKHVDLTQDISAIKRMITQSVDCNQTLAGVNTTSGTDCDLTSPSSRTLLLKDSKGNALTTALRTEPGNFQNTGKLGAWSILTKCDRVKNTLLVRAARSTDDESFAIDPLTKRAYDFSDANALDLVGGRAPGLCQSTFGAGLPSYIICSKTLWRPNTFNTVDLTLTYSAADCGNTLPDSSYTGVAMTVWACNGMTDFGVLQPGTPGGPGIQIHVPQQCGANQGTVLFIKTNP